MEKPTQLGVTVDPQLDSWESERISVENDRPRTENTA